MTLTSLATQSSSVRCAICARPARRGATLCPQCKAAVKRARQEPSVHSEFLPHPSAAARARPSETNGKTALSGRRPGTRPALGGWGTYATLIAFGVVVCLTGYLALGEVDDAANLGHALNTVPAIGASSSAAKSRPPLPSLAVDDVTQAENAHPADASEAQPSALPVAEKRPTPKPVQQNLPLPGFDPSYVIVEPTAPPVAREVAAVPPVVEMPEPVVPDRWQLLASAMSRCERENPIGGFLCKERARLQYCEGHWGSAPQCPASVASSNTR